MYITWLYVCTLKIQVNCEVIKKYFRIVRSTGDAQHFFFSKFRMSRCQSLRGNVGTSDSGPPILPWNVSLWDIASNFVIYKRDIVCDSVWASCLNFSYAVSVCSHMSFPALFGFIYKTKASTKNHLRRRFRENWNVHRLNLWDALFCHIIFVA